MKQLESVSRPNAIGVTDQPAPSLKTLRKPPIGVVPHTVEAKYPFPSSKREPLKQAIRAICLPDGRFPEDDINSIYFDTPNLDLLSQKESSDYLKTKIRVRWYGRSLREAENGCAVAFMERKSKTGTLRHKPRIKLRLPVAMLQEGSEDLYGVARELVGPLGEIAPDLGPLFPMIVVRYRRARFVEPTSAARLSLDSSIRFSSANTIFFPPSPPRRLAQGVLEVKNADGCLPRSLLAARYFLYARDSFSKYEECWQAHSDPLHHRHLRWTHYER